MTYDRRLAYEQAPGDLYEMCMAAGGSAETRCINLGLTALEFFPPPDHPVPLYAPGPEWWEAVAPDTQETLADTVYWSCVMSERDQAHCTGMMEFILGLPVESAEPIIEPEAQPPRIYDHEPVPAGGVPCWAWFAGAFAVLLLMGDK